MVGAVLGLAVLGASAAPASAASPTKIDSTQLDGVACPSTSQCTAVDFGGYEVTFNPNSPGNPTPTKIDTYVPNAGLARRRASAPQSMTTGGR